MQRTVVIILALLLLAAGCAESSGDRKAEFLDTWLREEASRLGGAARKRVARALLHAEDTHGIDALLLVAVIEEESRYDPAARGPKGAQGLMQLRAETAREVAGRVGIRISDDPATNVLLGAAYLAELKERFVTWEAALAAYNAGPGRVRRLESRGRKIPAGYASRVRERHRRIQAVFAEKSSPAAEEMKR